MMMISGRFQTAFLCAGALLIALVNPTKGFALRGKDEIGLGVDGDVAEYCVSSTCAPMFFTAGLTPSQVSDQKFVDEVSEILGEVLYQDATYQVPFVVSPQSPRAFTAFFPNGKYTESERDAKTLSLVKLINKYLGPGRAVATISNVNPGGTPESAYLNIFNGAPVVDHSIDLDKIAPWGLSVAFDKSMTASNKCGCSIQSDP